MNGLLLELTQEAQSQQQKGYDFPFELQIADYAGNEVSNRGSGPDGPLRIQVPDPYFSPNGDSVKDSLSFKVIAETSEAYTVQIKRNGATVKSWNGLTGEQNLSWDGKQNGQALADGNYRIVAMTEKQRDRVRGEKMVVLDTIGPVIDEPELVTRKDGKLELSILVRDPGAPGQISGLALEDVRIELDSDSAPFASEPTKSINNSNNKVNISALLNDPPLEPVEAGFEIQVLGDGGGPITVKGKTKARDLAGTSSQSIFGDNTLYCLHQSAINEMRGAYQKALRELDKLLKELETPSRQSTLPFEITSVGDFSIQAVVQCETGECDTPNLASALVDHYRNLNAREEAEFRGFHAKVLLQRQRDGYYAQAIAKSIGEGALLFAMPVGAEFGLGLEIYYFMKAWRGLSPMTAAYILTKDYQPLMEILKTYRAYFFRAVNVLKTADSKNFCVPPQTLANTRQLERGMVNFSDDFKLKIGTQADEMLLIDEQTFKILNPKALLTGPKAFYVKNSSGNIIGSIELPKLDNINNRPVAMS